MPKINWRPETLKNPYEHSPFCGQPGAPCRACGWEAGADAMLAKLRERAYTKQTISTNGRSLISISHPDNVSERGAIYRSGSFVFIPDEEESYAKSKV